MFLSAIQFGIPQIIIPENPRTGQRKHGRTAEALGVGQLVESIQSDSTRLKDKVQLLLNDSTCKRQCDHLSDALKESDRAAKLKTVRELERVLQG